MGVSHVGRLIAFQETTFAIAQGVVSDRDQRVIRTPDLSGLVSGRAPDQTHYDRIHEVFQRVDLSQFGSKVSVPVYLTGLGAAIASGGGVTYPANDVSVLLRSLMGGALTPAAGGSVLTPGTTSGFTLQAGQGPSFTKGGACIVSATSGYHMREIAQVSGDFLYLKQQLSATTTTGANVYNCCTFYFDEDNWGGDASTLALRFAGLLTNDQWIMRGCAGDFSISSEIDGLLAMTMELQVTQWAKSAATSFPGAGFLGGVPLACKGGHLLWHVPGTTTLNILPVDRFNFKPGVKFAPDRALDGIETVKRYHMLRADTTAHLEINGYQNFDEFWTHTDTQSTTRSAMLVLGSSPVISSVGTGMIGLSMPTAQYVARPKRMSNGELVRVGIDLEAREDTAVTSPTTGTSATADIHRSKFRVHVG